MKESLEDSEGGKIYTHNNRDNIKKMLIENFSLMKKEGKYRGKDNYIL